MAAEVPGAEEERGGHAVRRFPLALSTTALALGWARQENADHGSVVVADREVSPLGRHARIWAAPAQTTFSCAVIVRPDLSAEEGDAVWLLGGLLALRAIEGVSERSVTTWWPERVLDAQTDEEVAMVKADVQLRPGQVASAVLTLRFDLDRLGLGAGDRDRLLDALLSAVDSHAGDSGATGLAASYESNCGLIGRRIKAVLLPKGETRGTAKGVDRHARLQVASATGMVEPVAVDGLRSLEVVA